MKLPDFFKDKQNILIVLLATFGVILVSVGTFFYVSAGGENVVEEKAPKSEILELQDPDNILTGAVLRLDPFVLNLKNNSGILRFKITLVFYEFELPPTINSLIPMYRDRIISIATSFNGNELLKLKNRRKFKKELLESVNKDRSVEEQVVDIYFEEFNIRE